MRKRNLKYIIGVLFMTFQFQTFAQETEMEKKISKLFFGLDINQKPSEITKQSDFEFEFSTIKNLSEQYVYSAEFKEYPNIDYKIKNGTFKIEFDSSTEKQGIFELLLLIDLNNKTDLIKAYEELKSIFKDYVGEETAESISHPQYGFDSKHIIYYQYKNYGIPRLTLSYMAIDNKDPLLSISFLNSWKSEKLKNQ
ncbi:hypothetical protein ACS386_14185 [Flavobacteriaceae bacterium LMO-SS05]